MQRCSKSDVLNSVFVVCVNYCTFAAFCILLPANDKCALDVNYITLILTISILFGLSDFLTTRVPQLQRLIYVIAAATIYLLFTIKYYYGADMQHYYDYYEWSPSIRDALLHPSDYYFEQGYTVLCSVCKYAHISFYWFTAIISTLYFAVIFLLWRYIPRKRSFALMILVVLDYNLIFAAFRQCLSVSFFILMVLALHNKRYLWAMLCAFLTVWMHKSGAFVVGISLAFWLIRGQRFPQWVYPLLLMLLLLLLVLPMSKIWLVAAQLLHLPGGYSASLMHHLGLGKQIQTVFLLYLMLLLCMSHFQQYAHTRFTTIASFVLTGTLLIVLLYQSYYLLGRLRSYFLPVIIVYLFRLIQQSESIHPVIPYGRLFKQTAVLSVFLYSAHLTYSFHRSAQQMKYPIYNACTVFDLNGHNKRELQQRQLKLAKNWWKTDFHKGLKQNQVSSL